MSAAARRRRTLDGRGAALRPPQLRAHRAQPLRRGADRAATASLVGRGVTAPGGRPHAEAVALAEAGEAARGATIYVTLEPCSHHGATPPCADAIVAAGVARVVAALEDPDARVAGRGFARLRAAGIAVEVGVGEAQARRDHLGHILRVTVGRPMVTLKLALTADGYAAGDEHDPRLAITGEAANGAVQVMRSLHDAIMIGVGTARDDDPLLTVRLPGVAQTAAARRPRLAARSAARVAPRRDGARIPDIGRRDGGRVGGARSGARRQGRRNRAGRTPIRPAGSISARRCGCSAGAA